MLFAGKVYAEEAFAKVTGKQLQPFFEASALIASKSRENVDFGVQQLVLPL